MNATMLAAAQIIARADDVRREGGQLTRHHYWDRNFKCDDYVIVPVEEFAALCEALVDYEGLRGLEDMDETEVSFGADIVRQIRGGCKR